MESQALLGVVYNGKFALQFPEVTHSMGLPYFGISGIGGLELRNRVIFYLKMTFGHEVVVLQITPSMFAKFPVHVWR